MTLPPHASDPGMPRRPGLGELLLYGGVALVAVGPALFTPGRVVGDGVDLYGTFWFYWWIGRCVETLQDPSFTDMMFYPLGKDIFAHTGNNFVDALVAQPLNALLPYPDYQPVWVWVLMVVNALTFRPLARDLFRTRTVAVATTVLWMSCPFIMFELMTGRLTQAFLWFLPVAVHHFLHIGGVDQDARLPGAQPHPPRWRHALLAGLFTGLAAWTYWFLGYFMALLFAWLALVDLVRRKQGRGRRLLGWLVAGLVCLVVVSPGLVGMMQRASLDAVPGIQMTAESIFDKPKPLANNVAATLHGYWLSESEGQPMFAHLSWGVGLLVAALLAPDRMRWVGAWVLAIAFALGPEIPVAGGMVMPHYMLAYRFLPFFDRLWFPMRLVVIAMLAATVLLGMLLQRLEQLRQRRWPRLPVWVLPAAFVILHLAEQHRVMAFPLISRDLTPPQVYEVIGREGGGLIELPIGMARVSIAWQPVHEQPTFGGMGENAPIFYAKGFRARLRNPFIAWLRRVTREPDTDHRFTEAQEQQLIDDGFRWVVLDRQLVDSEIHKGSFSRRMPTQVVDRAPFYVEESISEHLGPPVMAEERLLVWDLVGGAEVPGDLVPTAQDLSERTWPKEEMPDYELWLRERGRMPAGPGAGSGEGAASSAPPGPAQKVKPQRRRQR